MERFLLISSPLRAELLGHGEVSVPPSLCPSFFNVIREGASTSLLCLRSVRLLLIGSPTFISTDCDLASSAISSFMGAWNLSEVYFRQVLIFHILLTPLPSVPEDDYWFMLPPTMVGLSLEALIVPFGP